MMKHLKIKEEKERLGGKISKKERFQVIRELCSAYRLCWLLTIAQVSRQQTEQKLKAHI